MTDKQRAYRRKCYQRKYQRERRKAALGAGLCPRCCREPGINGGLCQSCREHIKLARPLCAPHPDNGRRVKERYDRLKAAGLCTVCGKRPLEVGILCWECARRRRQSQSGSYITMLKVELAEEVKEKAKLSTRAQAEAVVDAVLEAISDALIGGHDLIFRGFGSFKIENRAARKGRNPRTNEEITIPASKAVKFTPAKTLKDKINAGA